MFVLQSHSDSLHILPSSSSDTNATASGCAYHICNMKVDEDVDMQGEEGDLNEKTDKGIAREEEKCIGVKDEEGNYIEEKEEEDVGIKELSALMKVYTIPCHDRCHINVMLVLQSCTDPLHILPSLSSQTSDGVCNFSNIIVEDIAEIEEDFMSINEEVARGTKEEEIPGDIIIPDINSERDEVSYICVSVI